VVGMCCGTLQWHAHTAPWQQQQQPRCAGVVWLCACCILCRGLVWLSWLLRSVLYLQWRFSALCAACAVDLAWVCRAAALACVGTAVPSSCVLRVVGRAVLFVSCLVLFRSVGPSLGCACSWGLWRRPAAAMARRMFFVCWCCMGSGWSCAAELVLAAVILLRCSCVGSAVVVACHRAGPGRICVTFLLTL
jgi:hypothetical protein